MKRKTSTRLRPRPTYDDYDYTDPFICDDISTHKKSKKSTKLELVKSQMYLREITMDKVLECPMHMNDYVWFLEHINMYNEEQDYQSRYKLKYQISNKYHQILNINRTIGLDLGIDSDHPQDIITRILNSNVSNEIKILLYNKYTQTNDSSEKSDELKAVFLM